MAVQLPCKHQVAGSSPVSSTMNKLNNPVSTDIREGFRQHWGMVTRQYTLVIPCSRILENLELINSRINLSGETGRKEK